MVKPVDFGGNPDHITLGLGLRFGVHLGGAKKYSTTLSLFYLA